MLNLKPNNKPILDYYKSLDMFVRNNATHETAIKTAFQQLLTYCCRQMKYDLIPEYTIPRLKRHNARIDAAIVDSFKVPQGYWEAKDSKDDLAKEVKLKFENGYPRDNIIFQAPERAIIYQGSTLVLDEDITKPNILCDVLKELFNYKTDIQFDWEKTVEEFKQRIPESAELVINLIEEERKSNKRFVSAFDTFAELCKASINPNLSIKSLEEMLVQHLLTERIFRKVFENPDFVSRNIIASEIDKVIEALTSRKFNRSEFLKPLDRFYKVLEERASTIDDYSIKQSFLNTVYEKFFQGFAVKEADTHGIVYTPQPIVNFMVESVDEILKKEFGRSLSAPNVHILDPFTGTGNFIVRIMRQINKTDLKHKFLNELHCNEIMLLPYYVASMNIEHEFYDLTNEYIPFPGICLVDTFQLVESAQASMFSEENTNRVEKLKQTPIFVYIGNPPYNAGQANENDNNKNRKYPILDKRVSDTFAKDSKATLKNKLSDPYIKAFRMAMDKVIDKKEGVVAYVTNNSFIDAIAMDGMRKHLVDKFDKIYIYNLRGDVKKNPKIAGTTHNVFGIQVGVSIIFLIKHKDTKNTKCEINFIDTEDSLRKEDRLKLLENALNIYNVKWNNIQPDKNNNWLNEGIEKDWDDLILLGNKESKASKSSQIKTIFKTYSLGVSTNRDAWVYNSNYEVLSNNIITTIDNYNSQLSKYQQLNSKPDIDSYVENDETKISWSSDLKNNLKRGFKSEFDNNNLKDSIYRPFYKFNLYYDKNWVDRPGMFPKIFPNQLSLSENKIISISGNGSSKPFQTLVTNLPTSLDMLERTQCFPFYTYKEDGSDRKENISDWSLKEFQEYYNNENITKWDIFYYIYAVLHKPEYKSKYAANLRRELPRLPYYTDFFHFAEAGKKLADLHINYETQTPYYLNKIEAPGKRLDWKVVKMKLNKDKSAIIYNDFLTLTGIPYEVFEYKLGNRSALDWIIDQYQIKTDKRSGITNDPNRSDEPDYIVNLIGRIITVSLETVKIVNSLVGKE
ncbi:MAG: N-6 DNA methylase [Candidatus Kapabacteria bacterium]|nr:N-6 DNA methylase [Candidatus Kapabacteria bacterium]